MPSLRAFTVPVTPWSDTQGPNQVRSALNQIVNVLNGVGTLGVSTAHAIYPAITGIAVGWVNGTDGTNTFVDQVAWNGTTNVKAVVSSTTLDGSPAVRTYTVVLGVLKVAMASGTYAITVVPILF